MKRVVELYQLFLDYLERGTLFVAMILVALLFLINAAGITTEQITGSSLVWVEEVSNLLFAWVVFLGAGAIGRRGGHIGVDILHDYMSPKVMTLLRVVFAALTLIVVWVMVYFGYKMALFVGRSQTSLYLDINLYYYYLAIPAGGLILGLNAIGSALPGAPDQEKLKIEEAEI
ncbi:TRAP transporter small permease [Roseibium aggregatum]|uniref:TRAP transporter small permease protein n=1 Tax=Roseibium aggregatum TaxID=187304 RepID=A0A939EEL3_9HYPH|nr:TRAP transporter small permease subunit [Roseibium aggregatum]MBN9671720.1 TRAP transporter small permease subunit [Roseibium aggregatum]